MNRYLKSKLEALCANWENQYFTAHTGGFFEGRKAAARNLRDLITEELSELYICDSGIGPDYVVRSRKDDRVVAIFNVKEDALEYIKLKENSDAPC